MPAGSESRRGLAYGAAAYLLWGVFPLFWPLLEPAGTLEILAQRMVWSLLVMLAVLACTGGFGGVRTVLRDRRRTALLAIAAVLVSVNWGTYIYGTNSRARRRDEPGLFHQSAVHDPARRRRARRAPAPGPVARRGDRGRRGRGHHDRLRPAAVDRADPGDLVRVVRVLQEARGRRRRRIRSRSRPASWSCRPR